MRMRQEAGRTLELMKAEREQLGSNRKNRLAHTWPQLEVGCGLLACRLISVFRG